MTLQAAAGGAVGMTLAMLLETTLLIIRTNRPTPLSERMPYLTDPHRLQKPVLPGDRQQQPAGTDAQSKKKQ